jgi:acyl carrier protein
MKKEDFINNFELLFDDVVPGSLTGSTIFKDLDEWNSLMALALIAMVDDEYNLSLNGQSIRNSITIDDLCDILISKQ